ncbi:plasmid-related protein [Azospirillum brasilense]|nr:plasmid-related protein [Azospirillum argentinense]
MKDTGIRIRVDRGLREAFLAACQSEDRRASDVLRDFMQSYVERHQAGQGDLFAGLTQNKRNSA